MMKNYKSIVKTLALASCLMAGAFQANAATVTNVLDARDGDIVVINGANYVYLGPNTTVKLQHGQNAVGYLGFGVGGFGYVLNAGAQSAYARYLDASAGAQNSATITAVTALKETARITNDIQTRIASMLDGQSSSTQLAMGTSTPQQGMAAGSGYARTGIWLNPAYTHISDSNAATHFKGNLFTGSLGADYKYSERGLAGLGFTYGHLGDGKTAANFGTYKHNSYSVSPYFAYRFNEMFGLDALVGYGRVYKKFNKGNVFTLNGAPILLDNTRIGGKTNSTRWFGGLYGTAKKSINRLNLSLRVGYLHVREHQKAFTETNNNAVPSHTYKLGTVAARLRAGYSLNQHIEPFIQGGLNNYVAATKINFPTGTNGPVAKNSSVGYMVGGGLNLMSANTRLKGGLEVEHDRNKTLKATTVSARVRYEM